MFLHIDCETGKLQAQLDTLVSEIRSGWWKRFAPTAQGLIEREQSRHFAAQASPDGKPWKPLSLLTIEISKGQAAARKREGQKRATARRTRGSQMLRNTRLLERSVTTGGEEAVRQVGANFLIVGTRVPYAKIQQEGGTINVTPKMRGYLSAILGRRFNAASVTIPPRPFLGTSPAARTELARAAADALNKTLKDLR